ncbi:MAG TPA: NAD-glutamate dehydrogenase [Caulobacteraceae bacterium]|jgi:glutamate dehydrogenase|nr:NAD-glutamate dehydrogenase [Caulobacteraceae bacterium]
MMLDTAPQAPLSLENLTSAFDTALDAAAPPEGRKAFLVRVMEDFRPTELPGVSLSDLACVLAAFWRFAEDRRAETPTVRLIRAEGEAGRDLGLDVLEIVQPDAPFLVDSVMGEVTEAGTEVRAMFHPIVEGEAGRTSMIEVWLAPVSEERRAGLIERVLAAMADVHAAVTDFPAMRALLGHTIVDVKGAARTLAGTVGAAVTAEDLAFLEWIDSGHFVFLGARVYDYPRNADGLFAAEEPAFDRAAGLGVLRDPNRLVLRRSSEPSVLASSLRWRTEAAAPVIVAKANLRSRVHRRAHMDYIGVRRHGPGGEIIGETRFVGLFTAQVYEEPVREIPLLRRKIEAVLAGAGFAKGSHNASRLAYILETYPRDELFQVSAEELGDTARDILHLIDRPKVKLFIRRDPYDRFASILFYAPRERYDERLRERAGTLLAEAFGGHVSACVTAYSDDPLARIHYIIGVPPDGYRDPDPTWLEGEAAKLARTWSDDFEVAVREGAADAAEAGRLLGAYRDSFPVGYRDRYDGAEAFTDAVRMETLDAQGAIAVRAYRAKGDSPLQFRFKLYRSGAEPAHLSRVLPILGDMGLSALVEDGFQVRPSRLQGAAAPIWVHEFAVEDPLGENLTFEARREPFEATFQAVWNGRIESDGFNRLVMELGASWREAALMRALGRYRLQSGLDPSRTVQAQALAANPAVSRLLLDLFAARLDPASGASLAEREAVAAGLRQQIETALRAVESLDHDRVLRRLAALISAITRTNYYQRSADGAVKPYISFKIASRELADLPQPKPFREIFVGAPNVEAVHLRLGPVARGGLRWSDRRDDFRTEVLSLVKAQQVKNAVIVPVGSKGGFYPKRLPRGGTPDQVRAEAVGAYKTFLFGLLDLTDNIDPAGVVVHPPGLVIHDDDDPYLVVAADKGTATFSDIANEVAEAYDFWLGDAFASGGSAGYDHKEMGITARGAWEGVKRHFRELGIDIQRDSVNVVGVGDMSGDVFGNGMLLSQTLRLRAAFDHRHIFLDPDPDAAASWTERKRLFDLPRSSWDDFDRKVISRGGGVFPRTAKSVALSEEARELLDIRAEALAPEELITAILRSRTDLLYLGGIGTYVKATTETDLDVGDKTNDALRINGRELRCKVVGEGANLGFTQAGRIEYALMGGRIDTDAIDNSAGVDTSDHEVNIKILTGMAERAGALARSDRDALLASMTDEVAAHVLEHNYDQTLALSLLEAEGARSLDDQAKFMLRLESLGRLDRQLEGLPDAAVMSERIKAGRGLTRPELSVLLAYGKLDLFDDIIVSEAPDDAWFDKLLEAYFPEPLAKFGEEMKRHRLRREIIATMVDNDIVNLCGPTFPGRLRASAGCDTVALVAAFEAARQTLRFNEVWTRVTKLDGKAPWSGQAVLLGELVSLLRGQTYWLARRAHRDPGASRVQTLVDAYKPAVETLRGMVPGVLSTFEQKAAVRRASAWIKAGAPRTIAHSIALMRTLTMAAPLADLAKAKDWPLESAAQIYHRVGGLFGFDKLRAAAISRSTGGDTFERLAVRRLIEDMLTEQAALAGAIMDAAGHPDEDERLAQRAVTDWTSERVERVKAVRRTVDEVEKAPGGWTFAKLTIANAALRELAAA